MMKLYSVRDIKAESFGAPMSIVSEGVARRVFLEVCQNPQSPQSKYPSDYMLFEVGSYDPTSGEVRPVLPAPRFIISATAALAQARELELAKAPELSLKKEEVSDAR